MFKVHHWVFPAEHGTALSFFFNFMPYGDKTQITSYKVWVLVHCKYGPFINLGCPCSRKRKTWVFLLLFFLIQHGQRKLRKQAVVFKFDVGKGTGLHQTNKYSQWCENGQSVVDTTVLKSARWHVPCHLADKIVGGSGGRQKGEKHFPVAYTSNIVAIKSWLKFEKVRV